MITPSPHDPELELAELLMILRKLMSEHFPVRDSVVHDIVLKIIHSHLPEWW